MCTAGTPCVSSSGIEIIMFWGNQVNNMAADALAPHTAWSSAATVLSIQDKQVVFHEERFQPPAHLSTEQPIWRRAYINDRKYKYIFMSA